MSESSMKYTLFCDNTLCVLHAKLLQTPQLFLAVFHGGHPETCDACHLQCKCDELFGPRGKDCQIYGKGKRWFEITDAQQKVLRDLFDAFK